MQSKKMIRLSLFLLSVLYVPVVLAQTSFVRLSLAEAVDRFTTSNLQLIAEKYHINMAEAWVVQAKLLENPEISLEQNVYNRNNGKYFDVGREGEAAVEIEQLISIAGQRNNKIRMEKINKEMAVYQFGELLRTLQSDLKCKFIELYYTRKS